MNVPDRKERDLVKCEDMRLYAKRARAYLGMRSLDEFLDDDLIQAAVVRCVEVVGEAARQVSEETRARAPDVPWPLVIGMRNVLAHDYGIVNLDKVYDVVTVYLPMLLGHLNTLIRSLEREVGWTEDQD